MRGTFEAKKNIGYDNHLDIRTIGEDVHISNFFPSVIKEMLII